MPNTHGFICSITRRTPKVPTHSIDFIGHIRGAHVVRHTPNLYMPFSAWIFARVSFDSIHSVNTVGRRSNFLTLGLHLFSVYGSSRPFQSTRFRYSCIRNWVVLWSPCALGTRTRTLCSEMLKAGGGCHALFASSNIEQSLWFREFIRSGLRNTSSYVSSQPTMKQDKLPRKCSPIKKPRLRTPCKSAKETYTVKASPTPAPHLSPGFHFALQYTDPVHVQRCSHGLTRAERDIKVAVCIWLCDQEGIRSTVLKDTSLCSCLLVPDLRAAYLFEKQIDTIAMSPSWGSH